METDAGSAFLRRLDALPLGYSEGFYDGRRYGLTVRFSGDGRRGWLFAEALGGSAKVSCNIYRTRAGGALLRPCEMPLETVEAFVTGFRPAR